jgi:DNA-directed RNA polymerase specialized sigma24 family protein
VPFEAFFEQERDQLYRAVWLATRNRFEAEELTQEAFVRVLERWGCSWALVQHRAKGSRAGRPR